MSGSALSRSENSYLSRLLQSYFNESSPASLFEDGYPLINAEEWLLQADYAASKESPNQKEAISRLNKIKDVLIKMLPDVRDIRFNLDFGIVRTPKLEFLTPDTWLSIKQLSLGYRTLAAWIVDLAARMFERYPNSENPLEEPAVVLIDEIDLHLHPKWQRDLIDYLTNLFPNTQFIVTTHSPLIVQAAAARDANLVVLRREGDHVVIDQSIEAVRGWRADQILTSDLFDLPSARPKETEELLEQRKQILSKAKLTKADEKKLKEISEKLGSLPVMENPEDDKAMDIIRRAAAHLQQEKR
jgi:predicted ATP-binding protein involved in virulence